MPIPGRLEKSEIHKCLKKDPLLRKSLGIKNQYTILKRASILIGLWMIVLAVTPLPESLLLGRIGLAMLCFTFAVCWACDIASHAISIEDAAENLTKILKKDPKVRLVSDGEKTQIQHELFQAECSQITQLDLTSMLDVEVEIQDALESLTPKQNSLFASKNQKSSQSKQRTKA